MPPTVPSLSLLENLDLVLRLLVVGEDSTRAACKVS
jgi:hypothetical protein